MSFVPYREYMRSQAWQQKRKRTLARAGEHCEWCGRFCGKPEHDPSQPCRESRRCRWCEMYFHPDGERNDVEMQGLEVHHRTYERLGNERPEDLVALCWCCHDEITDRAASLKLLARGGYLPKGQARPVDGERGYFRRVWTLLASIWTAEAGER